MGNSIAQLFLNVRGRHPLMNRPLIDYTLPLLLLPAQLSGSSIGVIIGKVFPGTVLIILAVCLLLLATFKTLKRGIHMYMHESQHGSGLTAPLIDDDEFGN